MIEFADLKLIQAIANSPSLAAAARFLNVTPPAVSQRLALLESRLKIRLVERTGAKIRLTSDGEHMAIQANEIMKNVEHLQDDLAIRRETISGPLHVIASFGFGRSFIAGALADFTLQNSDISPALTLSDDPASVIKTDRWDVLIHVGSLDSGNVTQRKIKENKRFLCAAPAYLNNYGTPKTPKDLLQHRCGVIREDQADVSLWQLKKSGQKPASIRVEPTFSSNDGEVVRDWAIRGMGIIERSEWSVQEDFSQGRLTQVLPDWRLPDADVIAVLNPRALRNARSEKFVDFLISTFR